MSLIEAIEAIVVIAACLCAVAWIDGNNRRRNKQTNLILRTLHQPIWNGQYDTCPECGVMQPCQAHEQRAEGRHREP